LKYSKTCYPRKKWDRC